MLHKLLIGATANAKVPSTWTAGGNLIAGRHSHAGAGTQSAGLAFGGYANGTVMSSTEEYDGATWTSGGNLLAIRYYHAGAGTQSAGLAFGGILAVLSRLQPKNTTSSKPITRIQTDQRATE